jgi:hypothetical protein
MCFEVIPASQLLAFEEERNGSTTNGHEKASAWSPKGKQPGRHAPLSVIGFTHINRSGRIALPRQLVSALRAHGNEVLLFGRSGGFQVWDPVDYENHIRREPFWSDEDEVSLRGLEI